MVSLFVGTKFCDRQQNKRKKVDYEHVFHSSSFIIIKKIPCASDMIWVFSFVVKSIQKYLEIVSDLVAWPNKF